MTVGSPNLRNNILLRIQENQVNIPIDLYQDPAAFPQPTLFNWNKDGQPLRTDLLLTYSSVTFDTVSRVDAGNYRVSATNFVLPGSPGTNQVGNDTGSFYLDVICKQCIIMIAARTVKTLNSMCLAMIIYYDTPLADGPSLALGPSQYYVLLGDKVSLVCGTGMDSNPQATITWIAPDRTTITDNARFNLENGPDIVRLNLSRTLLGDAGIWRCDIRTKSDQYITNNGSLVRTNITVIGAPIQHDIELIIIG